MYNTVVEDVREAFLDEGVDEQVLQDIAAKLSAA